MEEGKDSPGRAESRETHLIYVEREHTLYAVCNSGIFEIDLSPIVQGVNEIFQKFSNSSGDSSELSIEAWPNSISKCIHSSGATPYSHANSYRSVYGAPHKMKLGFAIVDDVYTNGLYFILNDALKLTGAQRSISSVNALRNSVKGMLCTPILMNNEPKYQLPDFSAMLPGIASINSGTKYPNLKQLEYPKFGTLPAVEALSNASSHLSEGIINMATAMKDMCDR